MRMIPHVLASFIVESFLQNVLSGSATRFRNLDMLQM